MKYKAYIIIFCTLLFGCFFSENKEREISKKALFSILPDQDKFTPKNIESTYRIWRNITSFILLTKTTKNTKIIKSSIKLRNRRNQLGYTYTELKTLKIITEEIEIYLILVC